MQKYLCALIFLLVYPGTNIYALKIESKSNHSESEFILVHDIGKACDTIAESDTLKGNQYCQQLIRIAENSNDSLLKAEAFRIAGNMWAKLNEFGFAFHWLSEAIDISRKYPSKQGKNILAKSLVNTAILLHQNGDFGSALNYYLEAEMIFFIENDISWLIRVYASLGDLYDKLAQPEKREIYNEKAFSLVTKSDDCEAQIKAYTSKANNLSNNNNFDDALAYYRKTIELAQTLKNLHLEHVAYYNLGYTYSRMDKYDEAYKMYSKSFEIFSSGVKNSDVGDALYKMGLMKFYSGDYIQSRQLLWEAMDVAEFLDSKILKRNIYDVLYSLEEATGNYQKAYEFLNNYIDVEYEIFSEEDQRQVNFMKAKFDAEKREFQIRQLEDEKKIQSLGLRKQQYLILTLVSLFLLGLAIGILFFRKNRDKQKLVEKQAELQEQKIRELEKERQLIATKSVLQGEESERSRLASDLHDGLGGLLSGVKINLSFMKENSVLSHDQVLAFNHALSLLDTSISELRRIAHNMAPETLLYYGLKTALTDFCTQISPIIEFNFFGDDIRYSNELELTIYRIAQELVNNAVKHSGATKINIQIFTEAERISLQVFDNGKGFVVPGEGTVLEGKGLKNIANRVESLGGKFEILSQPGSGVETYVEFHLN